MSIEGLPRSVTPEMARRLASFGRWRSCGVEALLRVLHSGSRVPLLLRPTSTTSPRSSVHEAYCPVPVTGDQAMDHPPQPLSRARELRRACLMRRVSWRALAGGRRDGR